MLKYPWLKNQSIRLDSDVLIFELIKKCLYLVSKK